MPSYKIHLKINCLLALPLLLVGLYFTLHPPLAITLVFSCAFIYTTLFMNPDMDLAHRIKWYSLRGLLSLPFRSYSRFFRHRGLSHSLLFGSLTRILWLVLWLIVLCAVGLLSMTAKELAAYYPIYKQEFLYALAGIFLADMTHVLTDKLF